MLALRGLVLLTVASCATTPEPEGPPTFTAVYATLFPRSTKYQCDFCHGLPPNEKSNGKLSMGMDQPTAYAALVGMPSTGDTCGGMQLVLPGDPDASLLVLKFGDAPPCGDRMPLAGARLSAGQLDQVRTWIAEGAQDD